MRASRAVWVVATLLGGAVACAAFQGEDETPPDTGADAGAQGGDGGGAACDQLRPGEGPPPLRPEGGIERACGDVMVDLATNPANCGTCGRGCTGPCVDGACASEAVFRHSNGIGVAYVRRDRFVVLGQNEAVEVQPDGGGARVLGSASGSGCCAGVVQDGEADWFVKMGGEAQLLLPDGGASARLSLIDTNASSLVALPTALAYIGSPPSSSGADATGIHALPKSGGAHYPLAEHEPFAAVLTHDGTALVWGREPLRYSAGGQGQIVRRDDATGDTRRSGPVDVSGAIGFDATFLYFFDGVTREIRRLPKQGLQGSTGEKLARWLGPEDDALAITTSADFVYLSLTTRGSRGSSILARVPRCGGEPIVVARDGQRNFTGLPLVHDGRLWFGRYNALQFADP